MAAAFFGRFNLLVGNSFSIRLCSPPPYVYIGLQTQESTACFPCYILYEYGWRFQ